MTSHPEEDRSLVTAVMGVSDAGSGLGVVGTTIGARGAGALLGPDVDIMIQNEGVYRIARAFVVSYSRRTVVWTSISYAPGNDLPVTTASAPIRSGATGRE